MKTRNQTLRTILLVLALIGSATTASAYDFVVNGIYYNYKYDGNNEVYVTYQGYKGYNSNGSRYGYYNDNVGNVIIPESVRYNGNEYSVTAIGEFAFYNYDNQYIITSITLPNTIKSIAQSAFFNCLGENNEEDYQRDSRRNYDGWTYTYNYFCGSQYY